MSARITERPAGTPLLELPGPVFEQLRTSDRYASYFVAKHRVMRIVDTKTGEVQDFPSCPWTSEWGMYGARVLVPCPDGTAILADASTGERTVVQPPMPRSTEAYYALGSIWMEGSVPCGEDDECCLVYRRIDSGETRRSPAGDDVERDLDDPGLARVHICKRFDTRGWLGRDVRQYLWRRYFLHYIKGRFALGTCASGKQRYISAAARIPGVHGSLRGGWTAWQRDETSARLHLTAYDIRRNVRYRWPAVSLRGGSGMDRVPLVRTTRYAAIVLTWARSDNSPSIAGNYYRAWMAKRP